MNLSILENIFIVVIINKIELVNPGIDADPQSYNQEYREAYRQFLSDLDRCRQGSFVLLY